MTEEDPRTRGLASTGPRVLVFFFLADDIFIVYDCTQVSLVNRVTLVGMLKDQREDQT